MRKIDQLNKILTDYKATTEGHAFRMRLDFANIIRAQLKRQNLTQAQLAEMTGKLEPSISNLIHSNSNCTLETVATVLHALGVQARIIPNDAVPETYSPFEQPYTAEATTQIQDNNNGEETIIETYSTTEKINNNWNCKEAICTILI